MLFAQTKVELCDGPAAQKKATINLNIKELIRRKQVNEIETNRFITGLSSVAGCRAVRRYCLRCWWQLVGIAND
jgi:hypothetical protein